MSRARSPVFSVLSVVSVVSVVSVARTGAACAVIAAAAACFDAAPGDDDVILCVDDDDCPAPRVCAEASHVCVAPGAVVDVDPAGVESIAIDPPAASDGIVTVTVVADEDVVDVGLVFDGVSDPGVVAGGIAGRVATFALDVGARDDEGRFRVAEGFYPLRAVTLTDRAGNESEAPARAFIDVDRGRPLLEGVVVSGGVDGVFSDLDPAADVVLSFRTSEPVTVVDAAFGAAPLSCGFASQAGESCVGRVNAAEVTHGANLVRLTVVDAAGNSASASVSATVDLLPPGVLPGSVELEVNGDPDAPFAAVGDRVRVRVVFDEAVAGQPVFSLRDNPTVAFRTSGVGQIFEAEAVVDRVIAAGSFAVDVDAADAFGHRATAAVPLPAPFEAGLPLLQVPVSPCDGPILFGQDCADFDGDGVFGPSPLCAPALLDCDDRDPTIAPGALAIEGDGVQNDCNGDPSPPNRIYLDADNGDDANDGSPQAPVQTILRALALADADDALFFAVGEYQVNSQFIEQDLYGSLDPATWEPAAAGRTVFVPGDFNCDIFGLVQDGPGVIVGVDFTSQTILSGGVVIDSALPPCATFINGRTLLKDVRGGDLFFNELSAESRLLDAEVGFTRIEVDRVHLMRTRVSDGLFVADGGGVEVVSSVVSGDEAEVITCDGCSRVLVVASNLIADSSSAAIRTANARGAEVVALGVNARVDAGGAFVDADAPASGQLIAIAGSVLDVFGGDVVRQAGVSALAATGVEFALCGGDVCVDGVLRNLTFDPSGFRTVEAVDVATFAYAGAFVDKFSASFVADVDGECLLGRMPIRSGPDQ